MNKEIILDKIREIIEMYDSLVEFDGGKKHCILPEHYDGLAEEIFEEFVIDVDENKSKRIIGRKGFMSSWNS